MGVAFALLFPSGAILIRVFAFKNLVWVHAGIQLLSYILALTGMSLGIYGTSISSLFSPPHMAILPEYHAS